MQTFVTILVVLVTVVSSQYCRWDVGGFTLNLEPLQDELITAYDDVDHTYLYQICNNVSQNTSCPENAMVVQIVNSDPSLCYIIGRWDPQIMPTYDSVYGEWSFNYANGGSCFSLNRTWAPNFICDETTRLQFGTVTELFGSCRYEIEIRTRYACLNYTTTTTQPEGECIWQIGDNKLNLTAIDGFVLNKISDNDPSQIYSISPCRNNINCNGQNSMITISTISNCIQTVAKWDGGLTEPVYSNNFGGQWEFVYTNGDSCNGAPESVVSVFWNCNPFAGTATITTAKYVEMCNFQIQIDSNLACP